MTYRVRRTKKSIVAELDDCWVSTAMRYVVDDRLDKGPLHDLLAVQELSIENLGKARRQLQLFDEMGTIADELP